MGRKRIIGEYYIVPLNENTVTIARLIDLYIFQFYSLFIDPEFESIDIDNCVEIFHSYIHKDVFTKSNWKSITLKSEKSIPSKQEIQFFKQDIGNENLCWIVDAAGQETVVPRQRCIGYESLAVWEFEQVEERLRNFQNGIPNKWVELFNSKL